SKFHHLWSQKESRLEHPRLLVRTLDQLAAAHAAVEAEVVADQRARAGLTADRGVLDRQRSKSLRGGVDGRGKAGRAGPDDHDIEFALLAKAGRDPVGLGQLLVRRVD